MSSGKPSRYSPAQRRNIVIVAAIFIGATIFTLFRSSSQMELGFDDSQMTITGPDGAPFAVTVAYQDILSVTELDDLAPGVRLEGVDTARCRFGSWRNDTYGEYTLCDCPAFSAHIVLETADGVVAFNFESASSTHQLYLALLELLREHGLEV